MLTRFFGTKNKPPLPEGTAKKQARPDQTDAAMTVPSWQRGDIIDERYRVQEIFSGAMGKVYIAEHLVWGVRMAIKSPRPEVLADEEGLKRILAESNGWVKLGLHPNIAACYYVRNIAKVPHLFIEYIDGGTLEDWIKAGRCRDLRTALSLAVQFCNGMEYTHSKGIIHRDIKPLNILLTKNGILKITDFGILRKISEKKRPSDPDHPPPSSPDATMGFRGTPKYASPEQLRDSHHVDFRSDIFSFGICLWLLFCGKRPYKHNAEGGEPQPTPTDSTIVLPQSLQDLLKKSVAYHRKDRYPDFGALRQALNEVHQELFHVVCPYAVMENVNLQAESYNNRAVSLAELGKFKNAMALINRALECNDLLPEAIHNLIMLKWCKTHEQPKRIQCLIKAAKKRLPQTTLLDELENTVSGHIKTETKSGRDKRHIQPQLLLCFPKAPMEIFRQSQLLLSIENNVLDLLKNKELSACHDTLMKSWSHNNFTKNKTFNKVYEQLLHRGKKVRAVAAQRILTHPGSENPATFLAFLSTTKKIISAGEKGPVLIRHLGSRAKNKVLTKPAAPITSLAAGSTANLIATGLQNGAILLSFLLKNKQSILKTGDKPVLSLAFSPDNRWLAAGTGAGEIKLYNLASGKSKTIAPRQRIAIRSLVFLNDKPELLSGDEKGNILLWKNGANEHDRSFGGHVLPVHSLSTSQDGGTIASAGQDRLVHVHDSGTGHCQHSIQAHDDAVTAVLIAADNTSLITGSENDIIKVWDLRTGEERLTLDGRGGGIRSLVQGPRPHSFLAGRQDGAIVLWMIIYQLDF